MFKPNKAGSGNCQLEDSSRSFGLILQVLISSTLEVSEVCVLVSGTELTEDHAILR